MTTTTPTLEAAARHHRYARTTGDPKLIQAAREALDRALDTWHTTDTASAGDDPTSSS